MDMKMPGMGKMSDMRMSKSQKKRMFTPSVVGDSGPDYPWGLSITLDAAALKKLDIDELPDVGEECMIHATGKVTRVSESATDKKTDRSVEVQITKLALMCEDTDEEMWAKAKKDRKARY